MLSKLLPSLHLKQIYRVVRQQQMSGITGPSQDKYIFTGGEREQYTKGQLEDSDIDQESPFPTFHKVCELVDDRAASLTPESGSSKLKGKASLPMQCVSQLPSCQAVVSHHVWFY